MSQAVYVIWAILLVVVILAVPLLVSLLHRTYRSARNIEQYFFKLATVIAAKDYSCNLSKSIHDLT